MKTQIRADMMLVLVTLFWGISYYLIDVSLTDMGPFTLNMFRFLGAFFIAGIIAFKKLKMVNKTTLKWAFILGTTLLFVYSGATFGVKYTTLSNSGFICALTVIFVPILELFFLKKRVHRRILIAVTMSLIGIMLLTLKDDFSINVSNLKGDLFCLMGALAYAIDLILTEKAVTHKEVNAFQLGIFQLGVTGVYMLVFAFIFEKPNFPTTTNIWLSVIFLSIVCTGAAFIIQVIAQQYTSAAHVGIIFTLEPVFAGFVAFFLAGEILTGKSYLGAIIMIAALFVTEVDFGKLFKKKENESKDESILLEAEDEDVI